MTAQFAHPAKVRRLRARVALLSACATVLVLEIGCRVWLRWLATDEQQRVYAAPVGPGASYLGHTPLYQPHHWLVYALKPGYRSPRHTVRHNSLGFRGAEISADKPVNTYRIVALGASDTYCTAIADDAKTYPALLEEHLSKRYPGVTIEVVNAGVPGYTSAEILMNLQFKVLDLSPDMLIPYHAHNDIHPRRQPVFSGDYTGYRKSWSGVTARERLFGSLALTRLLGIRLGLWRPESIYKYTTTLADHRPAGEEYRENFSRSHPRYFARNLRTLVDVAQSRDIVVVLPTAAYRPDAEPQGPYRQVYEEGMKEHREVVRNVARETGAALFEFAEVMPATGQYFADSVHVNEAGAELKAKLFADFIADLGAIDRWQETRHAGQATR